MACVGIVDYTGGTILAAYEGAAAEQNCEEQCGICCTMSCNADQSSYHWSPALSSGNGPTGVGSGEHPAGCWYCENTVESNLGTSYGFINTIINATTDGEGNAYNFWKAGYPATECGEILYTHEARWMSDGQSSSLDGCDYTNCEKKQIYADRLTEGHRGHTKYFICTSGGWVDKTTDAINPYMMDIGELLGGGGTYPINSGGMLATGAQLCCYDNYNGPSKYFNAIDYNWVSSMEVSYTCVYWSGNANNPASDCQGNSNSGGGCCLSSTPWANCFCTGTSEALPNGTACVTFNYGTDTYGCDAYAPYPAQWLATPSTAGDAFSYSCVDDLVAGIKSECPPNGSACPGLYFWRTGKISCTENDCQAQMESDSSETP